MTPTRYKCRECDTITPDDKILIAPSPFNASDECFGCPNCLSINSFELLCDEPGCDEWASCGMVTPTGYRRVCGKHCKELDTK